MNAPPKTERTFYVVSMGKFTLLFFCTMGLYGGAWFFMHWLAQLKASEVQVPPERELAATLTRISAALLRSIFAIFFVHNLFARLRAKEQAADMHYPWQPAFLATFFIALQVVSAIVSFTQSQPKQTAGAVAFSLATLVLEYYILYKVQLVANRVEGDPFGRSNSAISFVNAGFLGAGLMLWIAMIRQMLSGA